MEGVTILNTFEVVERAPGWTWWALIPIAFAIFFIALAVWCTGNADDGPALLAGVAMGALIVMILTAKELPPKTHYDVIVDESVNFVEFNEKYEIIEQEGLIYTVVEKE